MKKLIAFAAIVMIAGFTTKVMAQATVTGTTAGAQIIVPITLTQTAVLDFGSMSAGAGGTCVLSTANVRSATGGVSLSAFGTAHSNAAYTVGGNGSTTYLITLPSTITVTKPVTLETMTISSLLAKTTSAGADGLTGTLSAGGADAFTVGGTLTVGASQVSGTYAGTFNVTVNYN